MKNIVLVAAVVVTVAACGRGNKARPTVTDPPVAGDTVAGIIVEDGKPSADSTEMAPEPPRLSVVAYPSFPYEHPYPVEIDPGPIKDTVFAAEKPPVFEGGDISLFRDWVQDNLIYPPLALVKGIEGRVVVSFVIGVDGKVGAVEVVRTPHELLTEETVRVLGHSPLWEPAEHRDREITFRYYLPVMFRLPEKYRNYEEFDDSEETEIVVAGKTENETAGHEPPTRDDPDMVTEEETLTGESVNGDSTSGTAEVSKAARRALRQEERRAKREPAAPEADGTDRTQ